MKKLQRNLTLLTIFLFPSMPLLALEPVATWLAEKAEVTKDSLLFPDAVGGLDLTLKDSGGLVLGEKSPSVSDAKSLTFDGTQNKPATTTKPIPSYSKVQIGLYLQVQDGSEERFQTILRCPQWELRFVNKTSMLNFIVWHDGKFTEVPAPFTKGEWHKVVAAAHDDTMELTVDDTTANSTLPVSMDAEIKPGVMILGAVKTSPDQMEKRALIGSIADIHISAE